MLQVALGWAPLETIRELLDAGADPNFQPMDDGFPSLIGVLALLLEHGGDVHRRGLNDWTALHFAAAADDADAVTMLLEAGADPDARTRIDDLETPVEIAERGAPNALAAFRRIRPAARDPRQDRTPPVARPPGTSTP